MLRFGFGAVPEATLEDSVRLVQLGEELGYDTAWMPDQTFYRDPFVVLTVCAQATERIRLMIGVTNPFTRHPAQVARAAATVDEVSGGRLSLAYGAGNRMELILPLGYEQTSAGPRCREAVLVTKRLLAGEEVHHRTDMLVADGVELLAPPRPELPVYLAGRGPYILRAAGEVADGAIIGGLVSPGGLAYGVGLVQDGAESRGKSLDDIDVVWWGSCYLTDDRSAIADNLKRSVAHIIGGAPLKVLETIGLPDDRIEVLKTAYAAGGPEGAAPLVNDAEIDLFSIAGDADHCSAMIEQLAQGGIKHIGILLNQPTPAKQEEFVRRFASEIMPRFR